MTKWTTSDTYENYFKTHMETLLACNFPKLSMLLIFKSNR